MKLCCQSLFPKQVFQILRTRGENWSCKLWQGSHLSEKLKIADTPMYAFRTISATFFNFFRQHRSDGLNKTLQRKRIVINQAQTSGSSCVMYSLFQLDRKDAIFVRHPLIKCLSAEANRSFD